MKVYQKDVVVFTQVDVESEAGIVTSSVTSGVTFGNWLEGITGNFTNVNGI